MKMIEPRIETPTLLLVRVPLYGEWGDAYNGAAIVIRPNINRREKFRCIFSDGIDWDHVSVSLPTRNPSWDEMNFMRDVFFEPHEWVTQYHPPHDQYVNNHPHCLHLWRPHKEQPVPEAILVGRPGTLTAEEIKQLREQTHD